MLAVSLSVSAAIRHIRGSSEGRAHVARERARFTVDASWCASTSCILHAHIRIHILLYGTLFECRGRKGRYSAWPRAHSAQWSSSTGVATLCDRAQ
ncbi:hypothetical protein EXIGLDRAFT_728208 [Exidia glandulosa HHB12029]|uniref:Uncharacterized protein n=1 Tax=Exidia glandulosa HHB12029 TaxID=1314781 RepID=A0A165ZKI4_EXIGL|nr:hypothetical protein EXIGLDRAFT_728208 [Exidia glandulosa HHB12029]